MLNIYHKIARNRVFDSMVDAEFTNAVRAIEHTYSIPPIGKMSNRERNNLEYRLIGNYEKSLMRIYDCYDKLLGITIPQFNSEIYYNVVTKLEYDDHAKNIALILLGRETFYGLMPPTNAVNVATGGFNNNARDFFSRYETVSDLGGDDCCSII